MLAILAEPTGADTISESVESAIQLSKKLDAGVRFKFNGVTISARPHSCHKDLCNHYFSELAGRAEIQKRRETNQC